jgi:gliding motility-associated-like protein
MSDKDIFKDVFSEKLGNYEAKVNPELWNSISSKIGTTAATSSVVGKTLLYKIIIGSSVAAAITVGSYFLLNQSENQNNTTSENNVEVKNSKDNTLINTEEKLLTTKNDKVENSVIETQNSEIACVFGKPNETVEVVSADFSILQNTNNIQKNNSVLPKQDIVDQVKVTDKTIDNSEIIANNTITEEKNELNVSSIETLPNIFTPNNDGSNDELKVKSNGLKDFSVVVMDSKNNVVYKSDDPDFKWNGIDLRGEMVEEGNYLYYITASDSNGKVITKYSPLKIIK